MNAIFLFNKDKESENMYLTRAARWYDVIFHEGKYRDSDCWLIEQMSQEEKREIVNYVYGIMERHIEEMGNYCVRTWNMYDIEEDFRNQFAMEVFRHFHKFNNPKYNESDWFYSFSTFIQIYAKDPARIVRRKQKGFTKRLDDRRKVVKKARQYAAAKYDKAYDDVTVDEIQTCIADVSKVPFTPQNIIDTIAATTAVMSLEEKEDYERSYNEEELTFLDPAFEKIITEFIDELRPLEKFIFLQNYEFCSDRFMGLTTYQLGCDECFMRLCLKDKLGKQHLKIENDYFEHIDDKFIRNQRDSVRNRFKRVVLAAEMEAGDLEGKLNDVMMKAWLKLEDELE